MVRVLGSIAAGAVAGIVIDLAVAYAVLTWGLPEDWS